MGLFSKKKEKDSLPFKVISGISINKSETIKIFKKESGISIKGVTVDYELTIPFSHISNMLYDEYTEEQLKNKSVVGRALIGGALTGGVGAIVGGASGIGSKKKLKTVSAAIIEYYDINGNNNVIILEDYWLVGTRKFIEGIGEKAREIPYTPVIQQTDDIPSQIKKLAELKDQGILTEQEFNSKKQELLKKM